MQIHELNTLIGTPGGTDYFAVDTGFDTAKISAQDLLKPIKDQADQLTQDKVNIPKDVHNQPDNGINGQLLRTKGDGSTEWVDEGLPTDEQTAQAVSDWLDAHPEATTTVPDGSLIEAKFSNSLKLKTIKDYVTPQMYGAVGDGVADDTTAIQDALNSGKNVYIPKGTYRTSTLTIDGEYKTLVCDGDIVASNTILIVKGSYNTIVFTGECRSDVNGIILENDTSNIQFNKISATNIVYNIDSNSGGYGVAIVSDDATSNGVYCNDFKIERIVDGGSNHDGIGIYLYCGGSNNYVTENTFDKSSIMLGGCAIKLETSNSVSSVAINGNIFNNINPETSDKGFIIYGKASYNHFTNIRTLEFSSDILIDITGDSQNNSFQVMQSVRTTSLDIKTSGFNYIEGSLHTANGIEIARGLIRINQVDSYLSMLPLAVRGNNAFFLTADIDMDIFGGVGNYHQYTVFGTGISANTTPTLKLSKDYGYGKIDRVIILANKNRYPVKVKDYNDNVLFYRESVKTDTVYELVWFDNRTYPNIIKTELGDDLADADMFKWTLVDDGNITGAIDIAKPSKYSEMKILICIGTNATYTIEIPYNNGIANKNMVASYYYDPDYRLCVSYVNTSNGISITNNYFVGKNGAENLSISSGLKYEVYCR